jgi:hypothetical protein
MLWLVSGRTDHRIILKGEKQNCRSKPRGKSKHGLRGREGGSSASLIEGRISIAQRSDNFRLPE